MAIKKPPRKYVPLKQYGDDASTKKCVDASETGTRINVHVAITAKLVAAIEPGAGEFQMPWHRPHAYPLPSGEPGKRQ